jgi:hypothetical protein
MYVTRCAQIHSAVSRAVVGTGIMWIRLTQINVLVCKHDFSSIVLCFSFFISISISFKNCYLNTALDEKQDKINNFERYFNNLGRLFTYGYKFIK